RARTKGKTEAGVKYVKRNALADQAFDSFGALEQHLAEWMAIADQRCHGTTREAPIVRFERDERAVLPALPPRARPPRAQRVRLDAVLNEAARTEPTYLDFLDGVLRQEVDAKQRTRVAMGLKIAHFPTVKTLDDFDFKFQPSVDQRLVRELATARFLVQAENVLI